MKEKEWKNRMKFRERKYVSNDVNVMKGKLFILNFQRNLESCKSKKTKRES